MWCGYMCGLCVYTCVVYICTPYVHMMLIYTCSVRCTYNICGVYVRVRCVLYVHLVCVYVCSVYMCGTCVRICVCVYRCGCMCGTCVYMWSVYVCVVCVCMYMVCVYVYVHSRQDVWELTGFFGLFSLFVLPSTDVRLGSVRLTWTQDLEEWSFVWVEREGGGSGDRV